MTSTFDPEATTVDVLDRTRNLAPFQIQPPALRRSDVSGEFPLYQPGTIAVVDQPRAALEATLVHEAPLLPLDSLPAEVRSPAPSVYAGEQARPVPYRSKHRKAASPWWREARGAGLLAAVLLLVLAVVSW